MGLILCIETTSAVCSAALISDHVILMERSAADPNVHSSQLTLFIETVMHDAGISLNELDAVAVSMGPGSYTGLRIGVAAAKGLCYALDKPLIAISTMKAMAWGMKEMIRAGISEPGEARYLFCPLIDARRMEVYSGLFDDSLNETREVRAEIIDQHSFSDDLARSKVFFGGSGAEKCKPVLSPHPNAVFLDGLALRAHFMAPFAREKLATGSFEHLAWFEPFYLKDFVAGKPRVKGLQ